MKVQTIYRRLGARIRRRRHWIGLTQAQLAVRVKLSRASIANIETGHQRLLLHQVDTFARALRTTMKRLF